MSEPKDSSVKKTAVKKSTAKKSSSKKAATKKAAPKKNKAVKAEKAAAPEKIVPDEAADSGEVDADREDKVAVNTFVLSKTMVINDAEKLHAKLIELSKTDGTVTLDASNVEMIDTAAFQLLLAFVGIMDQSDTELSWKAPSEALLERAAILNLTDALHLDKACA